MYKMCHDLLDGDWEDFFDNKQRKEDRGSHDLDLLYLKDLKIFLDFLSFPGQ